MSILFFLAHQEESFSLNFNILETNVVNILLLIGLIFYVKTTSLDPNLKERQETIFRQVENIKKDLFTATEYYYLAEQASSQNKFWLESLQKFYQEEKKNVLEKINTTSLVAINSNIVAAQNFITTIEKKSFLLLQKYILYLVAGKILRKFLKLSEKEQSQFIETTLLKLRGEKNGH